MEEIKKEWGSNKRVPPHIENVFYDVISHYPEFKSTCIIVVETRFYGTPHSLRSYPPLLSLLNKRADRVYPIVINLNKNIPLSFYSLSHTQQKGILAHEFAHVLDYTQRSSAFIIRLCFRFGAAGKFAREMERATDMRAIEKGCGEYLLAHRERLLASVEKWRADRICAVYLSPNEIVDQMKKYPELYKNPALNMPASGSAIPDRPPRKSVFSQGVEAAINIVSFFPAIGEMIFLVYIKKIHKKPDWYSVAE